MKKYLILLVSLVSLSFAQNNQIPSQADMQKMMQQMQEVQTCMAKLDNNQMLSIQKEAMAIQKKLEQMCASGKRDKAQEIAKEYANKMSNHPYMIQVKKCTKSFETNMENDKEDTNYEKVHVCDVGFDIPQ